MADHVLVEVAYTEAEVSVERLQRYADSMKQFYGDGVVASPEEHRRRFAHAVIAVADAEAATGDVSDGHHTHNELYEYRMLYNAHAAQGWLMAGLPVVKSWRHSDGEECFGGGWFIVTATLPTGQVSNHYRAEHWDLFDVPEVDLPPTYDGHTPQDAADRLRAATSSSTSTSTRPR